MWKYRTKKTKVSNQEIHICLYEVYKILEFLNSCAGITDIQTDNTKEAFEKWEILGFLLFRCYFNLWIVQDFRSLCQNHKKMKRTANAKKVASSGCFRANNINQVYLNFSENAAESGGMRNIPATARKREAFQMGISEFPLLQRYLNYKKYSNMKFPVVKYHWT